MMPGEVKIKKSSDIASPSGPQSDGMERIPAIVDMSEQICGTGTHLKLQRSQIDSSINFGSNACETLQRECYSPPRRRRYSIARYIPCTLLMATCGQVPSPMPIEKCAHPNLDTIVYAVSGHGAIVSENGKRRQELAPGDFALIPAYVCKTCVNSFEMILILAG